MSNINGAISFKGLNYDNVTIYDREFFIKKDIKKLEELGKNYDIRLTSTYSDIPDFSAIDIDVKPLKDGLSFFKRLFRPIGKATFKTSNNYLDESQKPSIVNSIEEAIANLGKKMARRK